MKIVIKLSTGGVSIMTLVGDADAAECIEKWKQVNPGLYASHREMPDEAIPTCREFRAAWTDTTPEPVIDICMVKAREIHLSRIREKRNALLAELDKQEAAAKRQGNTSLVADVWARKQALCDLPQAILPSLNAAETADDLKAVKPI